MNKPITLIKIGGSLITDKNKPFTVNYQALDIIAGEIKKTTAMGKQIILGHGGGSFAHIPAQKYKTHQGILNENSYRGIAEVADVAAKLNRIVIKKLLDQSVNAVSVSPLASMVASGHKLSTIFTQSLELLLKHGLLPVVYGDQIMDEAVGCTVFSTEKVLAYLALDLKAKGYQIEQIIQCGQTSGVYDQDGHTIPEINSQNFEKYRQLLGGSSGVDVTGGMLHKVEETLALAKQGIPGLIIDGIVHGTLSDAIQGKTVVGTRIVA